MKGQRKASSSQRNWVFALSGLIFVASCGGGGGSSNSSSTNPGTQTNPPPSTSGSFGLTSRSSLAVFDLPGQGVVLGDYTLAPSFPNLSFTGGLFLTDVPGDDRLVVVQKGGQVQAFENDSTASSALTILDLSARLSTDFEEGLLGLAFDPNFLANRYFYVYYSAANPIRRSVISRFTWSGVSADLASEKVLISLEQPAGNHNGGMIAFGPDQKLYIAFGDGGLDPSASQDNSTLLGTIIRIDPHPANPADPYDVPTDNPFVGQPGIAPEIYAYGLRNPYRFSFDRQTGDLWVADVGDASREEINRVVAGGNYGWPAFEGTLDLGGSVSGPSAAIEPIYEYDHSLGQAIIGGYVYRGNALPGLIGRYLYADVSSGTVWALDYNGSAIPGNDVLASTRRPGGFGEDRAGEVYLLSLLDGVFHLEESGSRGDSIPDQLSETGLFTDLVQLTPASGLVEYVVNQPFWSDGVQKRRWIGVPDNQRIQFSATGAWVFPLGTVVVKHFEINLTESEPSTARRLETRLLVRTRSGWQGFSYRWNSEETEATLISGREVETLTVSLSNGGTRDQIYEYPSRTDCLRCHTEVAGRLLGVRTAQINGEFEYPDASDNQLRSWNNIQLFTSDIGDASQFEAYSAITDSASTISQRARVYLEVNCAPCHQPGGPTPVNIDLRMSVSENAMNAIGETPVEGDLGIANARIITPGSKEASVLWQRMRRLDADRMPPLSSHIEDQLGVEIIGRWIDLL